MTYDEKNKCPNIETDTEEQRRDMEKRFDELYDRLTTKEFEDDQTTFLMLLLYGRTRLPEQAYTPDEVEATPDVLRALGMEGKCQG